MALLLGGAISRPVMTAVLSGDELVASEETWRPKTLSLEQNRLVTAVAELILPATDTPGASDAQVNRFIDALLTEWFDVDDRERFLSGLADLETVSRTRFERSFLELAEAEQVSILEPLDAEGLEARIEAARDAGSLETKKLPFFAMMKEATLVGYYTSKVGMTTELEYRGFTGTFEPCVALPKPSGSPS